MEPTEFAETPQDVVPIHPFEFFWTVQAGLFSEYGEPAPPHVYEAKGLQLMEGDTELLIKTLRVKYNINFRKGSSILYRFEALYKLLKHGRALPFLNRGEDSLIVHKALVDAAAFVPLEGNFDLPPDRTFVIAQKILAEPEFAESGFREAETEAVWQKSNTTELREGLASCINCGFEFDPSSDNPFGPFTCSFHPRKPQSIGNTGSQADYVELWYFPCCGKREVGRIDQYGNDVSPSQSPGCMNSFHRTRSALMFISYSRRDSKFAYFLETELKRRGLSIWRDTTDIVGGEKAMGSGHAKYLI